MSDEDIEIDKALQDLFEDEALSHAEYIQAMQAVRPMPGRALRRHELSSWQIISQVLSSLAFRPENSFSGDVWSLLGIPCHEGPLPSEDMIERRANIALLFSGEKLASSWAEVDATSAAEFRSRIRDAREACLRDLPKVLRERRRSQSRLLPRWMEPSPDFLSYLHGRAAAKGRKLRLGLHLSNLQGVDFSKFTKAMPPDEARGVYESLWFSKESALKTLEWFTEISLMVWAPPDAARLQHMLAAMQALALRGSSARIHVLVPHDPYPGCSSPTEVLDLWWHPLLAHKWKSIVAHAEFFRQPTRCVFSGASSPLHHLRSLVIFTLSADGVKHPMAMTQWRPTLLTYDTGFALFVDCASTDELVTHRALLNTELRGLLEWCRISS